KAVVWRVLARLLAKEEFTIDQIKRDLWMTGQNRVHFQVGFRGDAIPLLPALPLVNAQHFHYLLRCEISHLLKKLPNIGDSFPPQGLEFLNRISFGRSSHVPIGL